MLLGDEGRTPPLCNCKGQRQLKRALTEQDDPNLCPGDETVQTASPLAPKRCDTRDIRHPFTRQPSTRPVSRGLEAPPTPHSPVTWDAWPCVRVPCAVPFWWNEAR